MRAPHKTRRGWSSSFAIVRGKKKTSGVGWARVARRLRPDRVPAALQVQLWPLWIAEIIWQSSYAGHIGAGDWCFNSRIGFSDGSGGKRSLSGEW